MNAWWGRECHRVQSQVPRCILMCIDLLSLLCTTVAMSLLGPCCERGLCCESPERALSHMRGSSPHTRRGLSKRGLLHVRGVYLLARGGYSLLLPYTKQGSKPKEASFAGIGHRESTTPHPMTYTKWHIKKFLWINWYGKEDWSCTIASQVEILSCYGQSIDCRDPWGSTATLCNTLKHITAHCATLQRNATHCNTLQHTAQHAVTRCNVLQHTMTYCQTP